jgi:transposase
VIELRTGTRIWIAAGYTDLRRGFQGLTTLVETVLEQAPYSGHVFVFRGKRGDLIKLLWWDGDGLCLFQKRLERGRFIWPQASSGTVALTRAQLSMLLEGIDWRQPQRHGNHKQQDKRIAFLALIPRWLWHTSCDARDAFRSCRSAFSRQGDTRGTRSRTSKSASCSAGEATQP